MAEKTITGWATGTLNTALSGLSLGDGVNVGDLAAGWISGEVTVGESRKGKPLAIYSLEAEVNWSGTVDGAPCSGVAMLPRVFRRLLDNAHANARAATDGGEKNATGPPPAAYYAHTKYRYELRDIEFFAEMSRRGLVMTEVREPNAPSPPASPEPLSQLFPEKRVAVFRIERREDVDRESR